MQFPIIIGLYRSRLLAVILLLFILAAAVMSLTLELPVYRFGMLFVTLGVGMRAWMNLQPSLSTMRLERSGKILVQELGRETFIEVVLLSGATVHPCLSLIRLETIEGKKHRLIVTADSVSSQHFKSLRVFLRWQAVSNTLKSDV